LSGSGPDWSLKQFLKVIKNIDNASYCIFCLSDIHRPDLKFVKPGDSHIVKFFYDNSYKSHNTPLIKIYQHQRKFIYNLNKLFLCHSTFNDTELLKIILYLKFYSDLFKKMLIFPCFDKLSSEQLIKLNTNKNFYIHDNPLQTYAATSKQSDNPYEDTRPNHMIESQHTEFYNIIINLLKSN